MGGSDDSSGVREEFLAEAQEIIESLSRDLLMLDQEQKEGRPDPDLVNQVFRAVHTLKGIAGMFGYHQIATVAHGLEDLLDDLRLGRVALTQDVLDVLFEGVDNFSRLLGKDGQAAEAIDLQAYARSIEQVSAPSDEPQGDPLQQYDLDQNVLSVLTEYEEHRLRTNVEQGVALYQLRVRFPLSSIDTALEDLKGRAKPIAEIITYLPSVDGGDGDTIDLDVLLASSASAAELQQLADDGTVEEVPRREGSTSQTPSAEPARAEATAAQAAPVEGSARTSADEEAPPAPPDASDARPADARQTSLPPAMVEAEGPSAAGPGRTRTAAREGAPEQSLRSLSQTVRVDIRKLDELMNMVGELALVRSSVATIAERLRARPDLRQLVSELQRVNRSFERRLDALQGGILDVRMVPLGQVFDKLGRILRQVAREHEKEVRLVVSGADTEVDKLIVEDLSDPLMHIIRNAVDHGIESPKMRELAGKSTTGTLVLNAYQKGNHVVIEVEDDGTGIHRQRLVEAAVRKGLLTQEAGQDLSPQEALNLIFTPGFSTRSAITDISGRGVGMDVVKTNIARLGGVIDVQSEVGTGTKFTITLPVTLAIISALLLGIADRTYAIPLTAVQEAFLLEPRSIRTVEGREVVSLRGTTLPICRLDHLFDVRSAPPADRKQFVVVISLGQRRLGLVVDALHGQQDIVIKSLGKSLSSVRGVAGATDLGDQRVALVLDAPALLEEVLSSGSAVDQLMGPPS